MKIYLSILISLFFINESFATTHGVKLSDAEKLTALTNYLVDKEIKIQKPSLPTMPKEPVKPKIPKAKKLLKGKYEKLETFQKRVEHEKNTRLKSLKELERNYDIKVKDYNKNVKILTDKYNNKLAKIKIDMDTITLDAIQKAYSKIYAKPYLVDNLKYDAESEMFYGKIKSTRGSFSESVAIPVSIDKAESFEKDIESLKIKIIFDYKENKLTMKRIVLSQPNGKSYIAMLSADNYKSQNISVVVNNGTLNLPASPLLSSSLALSEDDYSLGTINYSTDPEIAKLQKQKFELQRKAKLKKQSKRKKEELGKQKAALETQIALLEQNSGGVDDIPSLLKKSKKNNVDTTKWLFIVGIENYEYTNPVAYSANSAKKFKNVMKKRVGVPEANIRTLINRGATSSKIDFRLKEMLRKVKKGDTIYFYYSGHGIPVPSQNNTPYMLAQDMNPSYLTDSRFKLQTIYKELSNSKASKVIAFIDSCFSGGTDNQQLIKGVAATRLKPKKVSFDTKKMLVISAGSGTQYSNKYDEKSNRLFSYFLMKGLINNNTDTQRLYDYVKSNVQEKSYEMGISYEQVPVYNGNIGLEL